VDVPELLRQHGVDGRSLLADRLGILAIALSRCSAIVAGVTGWPAGQANLVVIGRSV
jgi:hypothetical protein